MSTLNTPVSAHDAQVGQHVQPAPSTGARPHHPPGDQERARQPITAAREHVGTLVQVEELDRAISSSTTAANRRLEQTMNHRTA